ncbi:MAG: hypothetical protein PHE93_05290 [Clostridia bacterium]|nr:hypothetical protein [Clostridia bacterium]
MNDLKLTIDLLPRGAWGNDLSKTLPKKDWDKLREFCYKRFHNACAVCGAKHVELDAHEVWNFDKQSKTQTLVDIIALCPKCHGVKHMRNTERIGFGENAKRHFCEINKCDLITFANHYAEQQLRFDDLNDVLRWKVIANLNDLGGSDIEIQQIILSIIESSYSDIDWSDPKSREFFKETAYDDTKSGFIPTPKIRCIDIDNYSGTITIVADYANKIEWFSNQDIIKTKYNICGKFITDFNVENLICNEISFKLTGDGGEVYSKAFKLIPS